MRAHGVRGLRRSMPVVYVRVFVFEVRAFCGRRIVRVTVSFREICSACADVTYASRTHCQRWAASCWTSLSARAVDVCSQAQRTSVRRPNPARHISPRALAGAWASASARAHLGTIAGGTGRADAEASRKEARGDLEFGFRGRLIFARRLPFSFSAGDCQPEVRDGGAAMSLMPAGAPPLQCRHVVISPGNPQRSSCEAAGFGQGVAGPVGGRRACCCCCCCQWLSRVSPGCCS